MGDDDRARRVVAADQGSCVKPFHVLTDYQRMVCVKFIPGFFSKKTYSESCMSLS
jgi:hypothetical protein